MTISCLASSQNGHFQTRLLSKVTALHQAQCISAPIQKRHTKLMRLRYSALPDEFNNLTLQVILGVTQRITEMMIECWYKDGFIDRTKTGLYKKLFLELT